MSSSFAFILNPLIVKDCEIPIEIIPNYIFKKADTNHINLIKQTWIKLPANFYWLNSFESDCGGIGELYHEPVILAPEDWKYWIIAHDGYISNNKKRDAYFMLECAVLLLQNDLELGPLFFNQSGNNYQWNPRSLYNYFLDYPSGMRPATIITLGEILEIGVNYALINDFLKKMHSIVIEKNNKKNNSTNDYYQENFRHIEHAIYRYVDLKSLPRYSGLTIIGLFSIIESLITHLPKQNTRDSINHQINTKIPLLSKNFQRTLDYEKYFAPANEETIWRKLYDFRSKIVHEGKEIFENGNSILNNLENVTIFLKETVKLLILFSLKEPQYLTDLKKC